eukprot:979871-Rhodomonas_salina.2
MPGTETADIAVLLCDTDIAEGSVRRPVLICFVLVCMFCTDMFCTCYRATRMLCDARYCHATPSTDRSAYGLSSTALAYAATHLLRAVSYTHLRAHETEADL